MKCFLAEPLCYCESVKRFDPRIKFVILIHPLEARRRIASGRMSHLSLENSELIVGAEFSKNTSISRLVENSRYHAVVLYPAAFSINLSQKSEEERAELFPKDKELLIFVIDGTWNTSNKMMSSTNLRNLSRICFTPRKPSRFRVRKQPSRECYSTLEAIHETIELVGATQGFDVKTRIHDRLLTTFDTLVENQLKFVRQRQQRQPHKLKAAPHWRCSLLKPSSQSEVVSGGRG